MIIVGNIIITETPYHFEGYKFALYLYFYKPINIKEFEVTLEDRLNEYDIDKVTIIEIKKSEREFPNDDLWRAYEKIEKVESPKEKYIVYLLFKEKQEIEQLKIDIEDALQEEDILPEKPLFQMYLAEIKKFPCEKDIIKKIPISTEVF